MLKFENFQPRLKGINSDGETKDLLLTPLSVTLSPGKFYVFSGPSGVGKSRLLESLIDSTLSHQGHVEVSTPMVSQPQTLDLSRPLSAIENVCTARIEEFSILQSIFGPGPQEKMEAREALKKMNFLDFEKPVALLSGGEQQRVAMARVLHSHRKLWILDEPVSQLDESSALHCLSTLKTEGQNRGALILCILHQKQLASRVADTTLHWDQEWSIH